MEGQVSLVTPSFTPGCNSRLCVLGYCRLEELVLAATARASNGDECFWLLAEPSLYRLSSRSTLKPIDGVAALIAVVAVDEKVDCVALEPSVEAVVAAAGARDDLVSSSHTRLIRLAARTHSSKVWLSFVSMKKARTGSKMA